MRSIVIKAVNWLGDLVISLPAMRALRRAYPEAHLAVLVRRELASFFDGAPWIDEILPYQRRRGLAGLADHAAIIRQLRQKEFELAVLFPRSFESALWPFLARIPRRVGVRADARAWMLTSAVRIDTHDPHRHQAFAYLEMVERGLDVHGDVNDAQLAAAPHARDRMQTWLHERRRRPAAPLVALAPGAAFGPAKQWPAEQYVELIDLLATRHDAECVLVGAPNERDACETISQTSRAGAIVAAGATSIGDAIALLSLCQGFAGNDSGSMHVAAALGVPTVGIFGSTNPQRTGPLGPRATYLYRAIECSPCLQRTCRFGHYNCLREIGAAEVVAALERCLGFHLPGGRR